MSLINFGNRSTIDVVVLTFTFLVGFVLTIIVVGAIIGRIARPELDMSRAVESTIEIINTLVGALIGFLGGRAIGRTEVNGPPK
jgi:cytochrome c biogenesis protein CcdA